MKLAPFTAAVVAGSLALGLGGVALAAEGGDQPDAGAAVTGVAAGVADDFEAFDNCLREQGVDLPEMPDLPAPDEELTDEQIAELDAFDEAAKAIEISDEAWDACEQHLPEGAELDDEAFAEFDQCLADNGIDIDKDIEIPEGDDAAIEAQLDAAFDTCEEHLPEGALIEDDLGEFDEEAFAEFDQCLADNGIDIDEDIEIPEGDDAAIEAQLDAAFDTCEERLPDDIVVAGPDAEIDDEADTGDES